MKNFSKFIKHHLKNYNKAVYLGTYKKLLESPFASNLKLNIEFL